jgi:hypothetical protein
VKILENLDRWAASMYDKVADRIAWNSQVSGVDDSGEN